MWKEGHELVISPSKWAYLTYMIIAVIIVSILGLNIQYCDPAAKNKVILLGAAFLAFMFLLMLLKRSKIKKIHPIIISEKGVQTSPENIINWDLIDYVYVLHERNGFRRYDSMDYFFVTEYHDNNGDTKSISININDFDCVEGEIEKAVKYWSGRDIGNLTAKSRDEIVSDKEIPEEEKQRITEKYQKYIPMFEEEKKRGKESVRDAVNTFLVFANGYVRLQFRGRTHKHRRHRMADCIPDLRPNIAHILYSLPRNP